MGVRYGDNKELERMNKRRSAARPESPGGPRRAALSLEVLPQVCPALIGPASGGCKPHMLLECLRLRGFPMGEEMGSEAKARGCNGQEGLLEPMGW